MLRVDCGFRPLLHRTLAPAAAAANPANSRRTAASAPRASYLA